MHSIVRGCMMSKVSSTLTMALHKYLSKAIQNKLKDQTEQARNLAVVLLVSIVATTDIRL